MARLPPSSPYVVVRETHARERGVSGMIPSDLPGKLGLSHSDDEPAIAGGTLPELPLTESKTLITTQYGPTAMVALRSSMKKEHRIVLGASFQVSSGSAGVTNQVILNNILSGLGEFKQASTLFTEFFISKFECVYQPASRYSKRTGSTSTNDANDVPLVVADLQHGQAVYTTHTDACSCSNLLVTTSSDNWRFTWRNTESKSAGVVPAASSTAGSPTQGWCLTDTAAAAGYTGGLQLLSPPAFVNPTLNYLYGTVVVRWDVLFRARS